MKNAMKPTDAEKWRWFADIGYQQTRVRYISSLTMDGKYPAYTGWTPIYGQVTCKTLDELIEKAMEPRPLCSLSQKEFEVLKKSGTLWELYPEALEYWEEIDHESN